MGWNLKLAGLFIGCLIVQSGKAQKIIEQDEQTWMGLFNQTRWTNKWGTWFDIHFRLADDFVKSPNQLLIRLGPTYFLTDDLRFTVAYNFINYFPDETHPGINLIEHRPLQQMQWFSNVGKINLMQRIRMDERFRPRIKNGRQDGFVFNWRLRYGYTLTFPLGNKVIVPHSFQLVFNHEVMFNFGKNIVYNALDQNRLFGGLAYQFDESSNLQFGYMNILQQQSSGDHYRRIHSLRLFYYYNIDLRKNE